MSDPQPLSLKNRPKRADPLQPDRPGGGSDTTPQQDSKAADEALDEQKERSETAQKNVSQGY